MSKLKRIWLCDYRFGFIFLRGSTRHPFIQCVSVYMCMCIFSISYNLIMICDTFIKQGLDWEELNRLNWIEFEECLKTGSEPVKSWSMIFSCQYSSSIRFFWLLYFLCFYALPSFYSLTIRSLSCLL